MKYRKKNVIVEAFQMTYERRWDNKDWPDWLNQAWNKSRAEDGAFFVNNNCEDHMSIKTPEGFSCINFGDYIIQGVHGELCLCKPDIFEKTYEKVE